MRDETTKRPGGVTAIIVLNIIVIAILALLNITIIIAMSLPDTSQFKAGFMEGASGHEEEIARLLGKLDFQLVFPVLTLIFISMRRFVPVMAVQVIVVLSGIPHPALNLIPALVSLIILGVSSNARQYLKNNSARQSES